MPYIEYLVLTQKMIKNIKVRKHYATGKWYANCQSTKFGKCEQWGNTDIEASKNLKRFVETHWHEKWPEVKQVKGNK